jgi:hypothetical protein
VTKPIRQKTIWDPPVEIGILLYPGAATSMIHGLTDMFTVATTLARELGGAAGAGRGAARNPSGMTTRPKGKGRPGPFASSD